MKKKKEIIAWMAFSGEYPCLFSNLYADTPIDYWVCKNRKNIGALHKAVKVKITVIK